MLTGQPTLLSAPISPCLKCHERLQSCTRRLTRTEEEPAAGVKATWQRSNGFHSFHMRVRNVQKNIIKIISNESKHFVFICIWSQFAHLPALLAIWSSNFDEFLRRGDNVVWGTSKPVVHRTSKLRSTVVQPENFSNTVAWRLWIVLKIGEAIIRFGWLISRRQIFYSFSLTKITTTEISVVLCPTNVKFQVLVVIWERGTVCQVRTP